MHLFLWNPRFFSLSFFNLFLAWIHFFLSRGQKSCYNEDFIKVNFSSVTTEVFYWMLQPQVTSVNNNHTMNNDNFRIAELSSK